MLSAKTRGVIDPGFAEQLSQRIINSSLLETNPPDHTRPRALVSPFFAARGIPALAPRIAAAVDDLLDELAEAVASAVLAELIGVACRTLNEFRARHGVAGIEQPPFVPPDTWNRFFLPLANQYLSPFQHQAVQLLAMFQSYTSMATPFEPTRNVHNPGAVMETAVRHWAARKPRLAPARPHPWTLLAT